MLMHTVYILAVFTLSSHTTENESTVGYAGSASSQDRRGKRHEQWSKHSLARTAQKKRAENCDAIPTSSFVNI